MKITLKQFKKYANENDILWFYNIPRWRTMQYRGNSGRCYTKKQIDELRKIYLDDMRINLKVKTKTSPVTLIDDIETDGMNYFVGNWFEAIFGTPEEREKERINLLNKKKAKPITIETLKKLYRKCKELEIPFFNNKKEIQMCKDNEERAQKHRTISELTDNLSTAVRNVENLADEVEGLGKDRKDVVKKVVDEIEKDVSLSVFLDNYPKRIEALNERVTTATNRLKKLLF